MRFEKTQGTNPHKLTIKQHVLPKACLERFCDNKGCISLYYKNKQKILSVKPSNKLFCAMRVWDQRTENGAMKAIEDRFQTLINDILSGVILSIGDNNRRIVNEFYALWHRRSRLKYNPIQDQTVVGIPGNNLTKEQEECLERNGYGYVRSNSMMPGRQLAGLHIQVSLIQASRELSDSRWGILCAKQGEFLVPDHSEHTIIPITPTICLLNPSDDGVISIDLVGEINRYIVAGSREYYFARDLSKCPV